MEPLSPANRLLCLNAAFHSEDKDWNRSARYDQPLWFAVHDTAYTRPGDYLRGPSRAPSSLPPSRRCCRPSVCSPTGYRELQSRRWRAPARKQNGYGGVQQREDTPLLDGTGRRACLWPVPVRRSAGALPGEPGPAKLDRAPPGAARTGRGAELRQDDVMTDETGTRAVISAVERTRARLAAYDDTGDNA